MSGFTAKTYAQLTGVVVGAVALLGIVLNATSNATLLGADFLAFDWTHNIVHVALAAIGLYVGFGGASASMQKNYAIVFGAVYAILGIVGFVGVTTIAGIGLEIGENIVHLVIGALGVYAGTMGSPTTGARA